jgi:coiled-coil domain-containing protein 64
LQSLEQERHLLRRKLEEARGENEARALELQGDLESLRGQLEEQSERARRAERDQANLVTELTAQNARLAEQLREAAKQEEQLFAELKHLREKCNLRSTTLQDHVSSLEVLRDEVSLHPLTYSLPFPLALPFSQRGAGLCRRKRDTSALPAWARSQTE